MPGAVERYDAELLERVRAVLGDGLVAVYASGSWALGDYVQGRSGLDRLVVSAKTVDHHVSAILRKLSARTRAEASAEAVRLGFVQQG